MKDYGRFALTEVAAPSVEPVTVDEFVAHARLDDASPIPDSAEIALYIKAARRSIERVTARRLITQIWRMTLDEWPDHDYIEIPLGPVVFVDSVIYIARDTGLGARFAASNFVVDVASDPARIKLKEGITWPTTELQEAAGILVNFHVGYGTASSVVPAELLLAVRHLAEHYYDNRSATTAASLSELPLGIRRLISPYILWEAIL